MMKKILFLIFSTAKIKMKNKKKTYFFLLFFWSRLNSLSAFLHVCKSVAMFICVAMVIYRCPVIRCYVYLCCYGDLQVPSDMLLRLFVCCYGDLQVPSDACCRGILSSPWSGYKHEQSTRPRELHVDEG